MTKADGTWGELVATKDIASAFETHFAFLASSPGDQPLLRAVAQKATALESREGGVLVVRFGPDHELACGLPGDPPEDWPASYQHVVREHGSLAFDGMDGGSRLLFGSADLPEEADLREAGFPWLAWVESSRGLRCAMEDGPDWWLFHPREKGSDGEPKLCRLSHEDLSIAQTRKSGVKSLFLELLAARLDARPAVAAPKVGWKGWYAALDEPWRRLVAQWAEIGSEADAERAAGPRALSVMRVYDEDADNSVTVHFLRGLEPLRALAGLRELTLVDQGLVQDFSPIGALFELEKLDLSQTTSLRDVSFVRELKKLRVAYLQHDAITDPAPLFQNSPLETLRLRSNPMESIKGIEALAETLTDLTLGETQVSDLRPLAALERLESLDLDRTPVSSLEPLARLSRLRSLDISGTRVTSLAPLLELGSLESLAVRDAPISFPDLLRLIGVCLEAGRTLSLTCDWSFDDVALVRDLRKHLEDVRRWPDAAVDLVESFIGAHDAADRDRVLPVMRALREVQLEPTRRHLVRYNERAAYFLKKLPTRPADAESLLIPA